MKNKSHEHLKTAANLAYGSSSERRKFAKKNNQDLIVNKGELSAYRDNQQKKIYVAHRGTDKRKDISADLALAFGMEKYHPRFKRARREVNKIQKANPDHQVIHTGHSLGGTLAEHTGKKHSTVVTFNKGAGITALVRKRKHNQTDYINRLDPVSFLSGGQRGGHVKKQIRFHTHPHKIDSSTSSH
jgi:hypothetical protein